MTRDETAGSAGDTWSALERVDRETLAESVDDETVRTVVKLLLGGVAVVALMVLASLLPGVDRVLPETPLTVLSLAVAALTVALVGAIVALARPVEELVYDALAGPERLRLLAGVIAKHLVFLAAVVVGYHGFAGVAVPFLAVTDSVWLYDVGFLLVALVPTAFVAYYAYQGLEPAADHITDRLLSSGDPAVVEDETAVEEPADHDEGDAADGSTSADSGGA